MFELCIECAQVGLRLAACLLRFHLPQCPFHCGDQAPEAVFQHEIRCAGFKQFHGGFLANRSGNHDHRNIRTKFLGHCESLCAIEGRQLVIGKDEFGLEFLDRAFVIGTGLHAVPKIVEFCPLEFALDELGIKGGVLK